MAKYVYMLKREASAYAHKRIKNINTTEQSSEALTTAARNAAKDECMALWLFF